MARRRGRWQRPVLLLAMDRRAGHMKPLKMAAALTLLLLFTGCTGTPAFQTGPDAEVTHDGLTRVDRTVLDTVWARTDIDLSGYRQVMFEGVAIEFRPVTGPYSGRAGSGAAMARRSSRSEYRLDEATKALVAEELAAAFREELANSDRYDLVDAPGPRVLTVSASLLDVVSNVPPETSGRSNVYLSKVGEATLVMELRDSTSNAILARAVDRRAAEQAGGLQRGGMPLRASAVSNRAEVRRLGRRWAGLVRSGLERLMTPD